MQNHYEMALFPLRQESSKDIITTQTVVQGSMCRKDVTLWKTGLNILNFFKSRGNNITVEPLNSAL